MSEIAMTAPLPDPIIIVKKAGDVRIHTFIAAFTDANIANATHIIESKNALVLIDGQFLATYAREFREYAKSLRKPIERLYLSHRHPDHWFGLGTAFGDIAIYALPETTKFIKEHGEASRKDHLKKLGDQAPKQIVVPQEIVRLDEEKKETEETIDEVRYIFSRVTDTEIDFLLTISLPELKVCITQDLIYSRTHLYLPSAPTIQRAAKAMGHWIQVLGDLLKSDYELFMPGHGFPADKIEVAKNIEYLSTAKQAIDAGVTKYDFKSFMLQRYPARQCPGIFDTYLPRLFDAVSDF
jgi:glyoxylase-like metal-dependent hydrolase (beta-lactamase superfamily II)